MFVKCISKTGGKVTPKNTISTSLPAFVVKSDTVFGQNPPAGANSGCKITFARATAQIMESGGQKM
jgi:hypothetical protein